MERAMFVPFVLVIVSLIAVRADHCDDSNALARYFACDGDLLMFIHMNGTSISRCKKLSENATDCYHKLWGNCRNGPVVRWLEYATAASRVRQWQIYVCNHLNKIRSFFKCGSKHIPRFNQCIVKALQSTTDSCRQWKATLPCKLQFFGGCSEEQLEVADMNLEFKRPEGCKIQRKSTVTMTPSPGKKGR